MEMGFGNMYIGLGLSGIYGGWDGITWTLVSDVLRVKSLNGSGKVYWNGAMWLATGMINDTSGGIVSSNDGVSWTIVYDAFTIGGDVSGNGGIDMVWNGGLWVVAGSNINGKILTTSKDGITWTDVDLSGFLVESPVFGNGHEMTLAWNGVVFVLGISSLISSSVYLYSHDGLVWNASSPNTLVDSSMNITHIHWDGIKFVGVGTSDMMGAMIFNGSADGTNYSFFPASLVMNVDLSYQGFYDMESNRSKNIHEITFPSAKTVAFGVSDTSNVIFMNSTDYGSSWNGVDLSLNYAVDISSVYCMDWNGKTWLAGGDGALIYGSDPNLWNSWNVLGSRIMDQVDCIKWSLELNMWVAGGHQGLMYCLSQSGLFWVSVSVGLTHVTSLDWNGNVFVASGYEGIAYSYDGIHWVVVGFVTGGSITTRVLWNGVCWIVGGRDGAGHSVLATSSDGLVWKNVMIVNVGLSSGLKDIVSNNRGMTLALSSSSGAVYYSTNYQLSQWSGNVLGLSGVTGKVFGWNDNNFLLGTDTGLIYTSPNGMLWKRSSVYGGDVSLNSIYGFVNNRSHESNTTIRSVIVAAGLDNYGRGAVGYSYDGIYWNSSTCVLNTVVNRVAYNGYRWVAVGRSSNPGWVMTSNDGIHWILGSDLLMEEGYDVAWNGTVFVAIGVDFNDRSVACYSKDGVTWTGLVLSLNGGKMVSIAWTGKLWIGYCSGSSVSTTYVSSDVYGLSSWTVGSHANMYLMDASSVFMGGYCSVGDGLGLGVLDVSSSVVGSHPYYAFDGSYSALDLSWCTSLDYTVSGVGMGDYDGSVTTNYLIGEMNGGGSGTVSGDWVSVTFDTSYSVLYYYVSIDLTNPSSIPSEWTVLGSNDNTNWVLLDTFDWKMNGMSVAPNCDGQVDYMIVPRNISGVSAYSSYRLVISRIFGSSGYGSILEWDLVTANALSHVIPSYVRPTVLENGLILFPNGCYSGNGGGLMLSVFSDVDGQWIQDYNTMGRHSSVSCANSLMSGLSSYPLTSHSFDGSRLFVTGLSGELIYLENLMDGMYWKNRVSVSGNKISTGLRYIYDSCSVGNRICLAGTGSGVITYHTLDTLDENWNSAIHASSLFSAVYSISSNSGNGPVSIPNSVLLESGSKITVLGPKYYDSGVDQNVSITLNLKPV